MSGSPKRLCGAAAAAGQQGGADKGELDLFPVSHVVWPFRIIVLIQSYGETKPTRPQVPRPARSSKPRVEEASRRLLSPVAMADVRRKLRIHGRVQGVFYRGWSVETARALGLAAGSATAATAASRCWSRAKRRRCDRMIERCREGPPAARVERIDVEEATEDGAGRVRDAADELTMRVSPAGGRSGCPWCRSCRARSEVGPQLAPAPRDEPLAGAGGVVEHDRAARRDMVEQARRRRRGSADGSTRAGRRSASGRCPWAAGRDRTRGPASRRGDGPSGAARRSASSP